MEIIIRRQRDNLENALNLRGKDKETINEIISHIRERSVKIKS